MAVFDTNMCYLAYSEKWLKDYKLEGDLIGKSHYEIFPEFGEEWKQIHRDCLEGAKKSKDVDRFERVDGSVQWLKWEITPWYEADEIKGMTMLTEDISALKLAQVKLQDTERIFNRFMQNLPLLIWIKDEDLNYSYVNDFFKETFKMGDDDIIGKKDEDFMTPENARYCLQSDVDALKSDSAVSSVERSADPDSSYSYMLTIKFRIKNSDGKMRLGGVGIDITDVNRASK